MPFLGGNLCAYDNEKVHGIQSGVHARQLDGAVMQPAMSAVEEAEFFGPG